VKRKIPKQKTFDSIYHKQEQEKLEQQEALISEIFEACQGDEDEADRMLKNALQRSGGDIGLARQHLLNRRSRTTRRKRTEVLAPETAASVEAGLISEVSVISGAHADKHGKLCTPVACLQEGKYYTVKIGKRGKDTFILGKYLTQCTPETKKKAKLHLKGGISAVTVVCTQSHTVTHGRLRRTIGKLVAGKYYNVISGGEEAFVLGEHLKQDEKGEVQLAKEKVQMATKIQSISRGRKARMWAQGEFEQQHRKAARLASIIKIQRLFRRKFIKFRLSEVPEHVLAEFNTWYVKSILRM
jgi:hypothetical protein